MRYLVVDDVPENLVAMEALLLECGADAVKATSGAQALELLLADADVALALLDVQMPGMNGLELAELMRGSERTRHIPLIFMTAASRSDLGWSFRGYEAGAVDFLYKPIDPRVLLSKVRVFFELYRQRHALARELAERTEALRINEMFMAVLGHDLRSPLMAISAAAAALRRPPLADDQVKGLADRMGTSCHRMQRMIEDLLDVTRIRQGGGLMVRHVPVNMGAVLQRSLSELRESYPNRVTTAQEQGDLFCAGDDDRLSQLCINLLGNAIQHGDPAVPIHAELNGSDADALVLSITNGGMIPPARLQQLFNPFLARDGDRQGRGQGLGLGLFIVQQIAKAHGGSVIVESSQGITRFSTTLARGFGYPG